MDDRAVRDAVIAAIDKAVEGAAIGVSVDSGVVVLCGRAAAQAKRLAAEAAARSAPGVRAVVHKIEVDGARDRDTEIAIAAGRTLGGLESLAGASIVASVEGAVVTLTGEVGQDAQKMIAEQELRRSPAVADVHNKLRTAPTGGDARARLLDLLSRNNVTTRGLQVAVEGGVVTFSGQAEHWFDRDAAERLAWTVPGVREVVNRATLPPGAAEPDAETGGDALP